MHLALRWMVDSPTLCSMISRTFCLCTCLAALLAAAGCGGNGRSDGDADEERDAAGEDAPADTAPETDCTGNLECSDGLYCNGEEVCEEGACMDGDPVICDDEDPCTEDGCSDDDEACLFEPLDADGDGYAAAEAPGGVTCGGTDCDDTRDDVYPGAPIDCDTEDRNCTDTPDNDEDGDGYISLLACPTTGNDCDDLRDDVHPGADRLCEDVDADCDDMIDQDMDEDGHVSEACGDDDCGDEDDRVYPGAEEVCDTVDQDCDGDLLDVLGADDDSDLYLDISCGGDDCNDADSTVHPGAAEAGCDFVDNDCDGDALDGFADQDDDDVLNDACSGGTDCDDLDPAIHPGAAEVCDTVDDDCDGLLIDAPGGDDDGDTVLDEACGGADCDDTDPDVLPGGTEVCDTVDDDCDGLLIDAPGGDDDGDTVLDSLCGGPDCDDSEPFIYPGAPTTCDMIDDDCTGTWADDADADDDGDTVLDEACGGLDCDDTATTTYTGAPEICGDGIDQNCDTVADGPGKLMEEQPVTTDPADSTDPSLAWSSSEYGVAWEDLRDGNLQVYFARVQPDGLKRGSDVRISNGTHAAANATLVWSGSEYGLSWDDVRDGNTEIYFARVSPAGAIVGSAVRVTNDTASSTDPSLAWTGSEYGVAWQDYRDGRFEIYFARISDSGVKTGPDVRITDASGSSGPSLVWTSSQYGVAWHDSRDTSSEVYFVRISAAGAKLGTDARISDLPDVSYEPSLVWSGSEFGVSWYDRRDGNDEVYFSRISETGTEIGTNVLVSETPEISTEPAIAWTGSDFVVSWDDHRHGTFIVYLALVSPAGVKTGSDVRIVVEEWGSSLGTAMAWSGSDLGMVFGDTRGGWSQIYLTRIGFCY